MTIEVEWRKSETGEAMPQGVRALVEAYWERTPDDLAFTYTQKALTQRFGVTAPALTQYVRAWGWGTVPGLHCQDCGAVASAPNRTAYQQLQQRALRGDSYLCGECEAERAEERRTEAKLSNERRKQHVREAWNGWERRGGPTHPDEVGLRQAILLLAVNRSMAHESMRYFDPASEVEVPLAPSTLVFPVLSELWDAGLLGVHPGTPLSNFRWEGEVAQAVYTTKAHLVLPMSKPDESFAPLIARLEERLATRDFEEDWNDTIAALQRDLWEAEVLAYLQLQLGKHRLGEFNPGEKTQYVIRKMLGHFTLGQSWGIVHRSVTKAAAAHAAGTPRKQAANSTITRMDGFIDRALAEGWDIKPYRRDFDLPPSALATVLWEGVIRKPLQDAVVEVVLPPDPATTAQVQGAGNDQE